MYIISIYKDDRNVLHLYFQYEELSKMIVNIQDGLAKTREGLLEAINRLELQVIKINYIKAHITMTDTFKI